MDCLVRPEDPNAYPTSGKPRIWGQVAGNWPDLQSFLSDHPALYATPHYLCAFDAALRRYANAYDHVGILERAIAANPPPDEPRRRAASRLLDTSRIKPRSGPLIFVSAMPKSASTYLCNLLAAATDRFVASAGNLNDFFGIGVDHTHLRYAMASNCVVHGHLVATPRVVARLRINSGRPIVLYRDIFDAMASFIDHSAGRSAFGSRFDALSDADKRKWVISRTAAHYVEHFASWHALDPYWISFSDIRHDAVEAARGALDTVGVSYDIDRLSAFASDPNRPGNRFNKGVSGRGSMFTEEERDWVSSLTREYPDISFRPLGLGSDST